MGRRPAECVMSARDPGRDMIEAGGLRWHPRDPQMGMCLRIEDMKACAFSLVSISQSGEMTVPVFHLSPGRVTHGGVKGSAPRGSPCSQAAA